MQAWRDHSIEDLSAIARVVRGFHTPQDAAVPENLVALGRQVYTANCVQCHGMDGRGDGTAAAELLTAPTNFRQQRPTLGQSLRAVRNGIEGTRMAAWTGRLNEGELVAVASYIRGFFEGDREPPGGPAQ
jgi:mono/diheme cytochrome c family protein